MIKGTKPTATKSDLTRRRILDSAAYILGQHGYAGMKLADVAKRANTRISTLYYYFDAREALVLAVLLEGSERVRKHTEQAVEKSSTRRSAADRLCVAVEAHLRYILEISHYTEAAVRNAGHLPAHMAAQVAEEQSRYGRFWQSLVDAAVAGADLYATASERRALRLLIIGSLNWTVQWWKPERTSIDDIVRTALTMTRRALPASATPKQVATSRRR